MPDSFCRNSVLLRLCILGYFGNRITEIGNIRLPVNNFVKTHKYSRMHKITNMNTSFSCFIRVIINVDLL